MRADRSHRSSPPRRGRPSRSATRSTERLAPEVVALSVDEAADGFDARFSATAREYRYRVDVGQMPDPFTARYVWHHPCTPDVRAMRAAARHLVGQDFSSFCRHPGPGRSTVRHLQRVRVTLRGDRLEVGFRANAFLHQMVRALTGILVAVGEGKVDPDAVPAILEARDRAAARQIAPPHGLTLERVVYEGAVARPMPPSFDARLITHR